jgi:Kef-type K+ transport system membrane component KefB
MGRIPHFSHTIFPTSSLPFLSLVANIGLVLFLFIIGLEVDFKLFKQNWRSAAGIGFFGLAIPFGIGAAVAVGIYNRFVDSSTVEFGHFLLFICVAFAITAFPVLCRILTELKLLQNPVGIATLAAGQFPSLDPIRLFAC